MQAVNSAVAGASELVVGREKFQNNHNREFAASVQVQADGGPSTFVYVQNRLPLFAIQLHTVLILPATYQRLDESG